METSEQQQLHDAEQHLAPDWYSKGINGNVADPAVKQQTTVAPGSVFKCVSALI